MDAVKPNAHRKIGKKSQSSTFQKLAKQESTASNLMNLNIMRLDTDEYGEENEQFNMFASADLRQKMDRTQGSFKKEFQISSEPVTTMHFNN